MTTLFSNGQHEDLGGGAFRTTLGLRPVNYLSNGVYQPIVNDWVDGDQDSPHVVSASPIRVRADGAGRRNLYPIPGNDEVYISIGRPWSIIGGTWQPAPLNPLERVGNRIQSINPNYNLYLDHAGHYAKLGVLLKNGFVPANNRFGFPAALVGLTRQGSTILYNGQPVMTIRPPVVYDWNNPEDARPITFQFTSFGDQTGVIFILPSLTGMSLPLVDPTLTLQPGAADGLDTMVNESSTTTNYGTNTSWLVRGNAGIRYVAVAKYDVSSIPGGATIVGGSFDVWASAVQPAVAGMSVSLARILVANSGWTEGGATWNFADGAAIRWAGDVGANGGADAGCSVSGTDYSSTAMGSFSVGSGDPAGTQYTATLNVAQLALMVASNQGLNAVSVTAAGQINFRSSDNATAAQRPRLTIDYTLPAGGLFWPGVLSSAVFDGAIVR